MKGKTLFPWFRDTIDFEMRHQFHHRFGGAGSRKTHSIKCTHRCMHVSEMWNVSERSYSLFQISLGCANPPLCHLCSATHSYTGSEVTRWHPPADRRGGLRQALLGRPCHFKHAQQCQAFLLPRQSPICKPHTQEKYPCRFWKEKQRVFKISSLGHTVFLHSRSLLETQVT